MLSHPLTFLVGYVLMTFILSFVVIGPLAAFVLLLFRPRMGKRFNDGLYWGVSVTAFGFMILHYLLYLRGYGITDGSAFFKDIFYPPQYF